jgi:hypothetical protein
MKNILVVSESLRINGTSSGIVSSTFIKLLYESGFKVTVVTENNFDYAVTWLPDGIVVRKFDVLSFKKKFIDTIPKVKAIPTYVTGFSKSFRSIINHYKTEICKELSNQNFDFIYALGSGSSFAPHFALAEMDLEIPYFVNIHDPFPLHVYPAPYKKRKTWIDSVVEKKFKLVLQKSRGISFPSQLLMSEMVKTFTVIQEKGFVIPHIGTFLTSLPENENDATIVLSDSKINILHAGTLLGPRNPEFLLQAITQLNNEYPKFLEKVVFTFIGNVSTVLKDIVASSNLENVKFINQRVNYKQSLVLIQKAKASLVIEAISNFSPFLPGKVADIAYANKPIINFSPMHSEVRRVLGTMYPYQSTLDNVEEIKAILYQFYLDVANNTLNRKIMEEVKNYVSIEENVEIIKKYLY